MSENVIVRDAESLLAFQQFLRFQDQLYASIFEYLEQRINNFSAQVDDCIQHLENKLSRLEAEYAACIASGLSLACSPILVAIDETEEQLDIARKCSRNLINSYNEYRSVQRDFQKVLDSSLPQMERYLIKQVENIENLYPQKIIEPKRSTVVGIKSFHGYWYQKARFNKAILNLLDPSVPVEIREFIADQIMQGRNYIKSPPNFDMGHSTPGLNLPEAMDWENFARNRKKPTFYRRLGLDYLFS